MTEREVLIVAALPCITLLNLRGWVILSDAVVVILLWCSTLGPSKISVQGKQHEWHRVLLASCRKHVEHFGIFDDVASHNFGGKRQVGSIKVSVPFTSLCQEIAEVFIECKQDIAQLLLCTHVRKMIK